MIIDCKFPLLFILTRIICWLSISVFTVYSLPSREIFISGHWLLTCHSCSFWYGKYRVTSINGSVNSPPIRAAYAGVRARYVGEIQPFSGPSPPLFISIFNGISGRNNPEDLLESYKYEKSALVLVDFSQNPVKVYETLEELKRVKIVSQDFNGDYNLLTPKNFTQGLIKKYKK